MPLAGIIFDMDGVLCDSEWFIAEAACRMFAETHHARVRHEDFRPFIGTGEDRFLGGVAEKHGVPLQLPRDKERTYALYLDIIHGQLEPLPGVREFIATARQWCLKLAVATSADRIKLDGNLAAIGLPPRTFDPCVTGTDIVHKKPHPEIFLTAAAQLGLTPASCVVIEDAPSGVQAAVAAGSLCLALTTTLPAETLRAAGATWIASNLAHVGVNDLRP